MQILFQYLKNETTVVATLVAMVTLGMAWSFQFAGYAPCDLCWLQRYPYMGIIAVGLGAILLKKRHSLWPIIAIMLLALWDAVVAGYHVGVEQKWWQGPTTCSGSGLSADAADISLDTLYALKDAVVRCDEVVWDLFGISMAGFNSFIATALTCYCAWAIKNALQNKEP